MDGVKAPRKSHSAARRSESRSSFHTHAHQHVVVLAHMPRCRSCGCQIGRTAPPFMAYVEGQVRVQDLRSAARWPDGVTCAVKMRPCINAAHTHEGG